MLKVSKINQIATSNTLDAHVRCFLTLPCTQSPKLYLRSKARYVKEVHVAQVGQTDQCVFAVVLLGCGAEDHQGHLPHSTAFMRRQLELGLSAHFGEREYLEREQSGKTGFRSVTSSVFDSLWSPVLTFYSESPLAVPLRR